MARTVLIDGDVLVYRTGFAGQQSFISAVRAGQLVAEGKTKTECIEELNRRGESLDDIVFQKEISLDSVANVYHSLDVQLDSIYNQTGASRGVVFISGASNYRTAFGTTAPYKGNRVAEKPVYYQELRDRLLGKWRAVQVQGAEADDGLAIALTADRDAVCASIDKDLLQVPGAHWNWVRSEYTEVYEDYGNLALWRQVLTGDRTDNIPGLPKVGPATAAKILPDLAPWDELHATVLQQYDAVYGPEVGGARLAEVFSLVYLCRTEEELQYAKSVASQGGKGLSPSTAFPSEGYLPFMRAQNRAWG